MTSLLVITRKYYRVVRCLAYPDDDVIMQVYDVIIRHHLSLRTFCAPYSMSASSMSICSESELKEENCNRKPKMKFRKSKKGNIWKSTKKGKIRRKNDQKRKNDRKKLQKQKNT